MVLVTFYRDSYSDLPANYLSNFQAWGFMITFNPGAQIMTIQQGKSVRPIIAKSGAIDQDIKV